jgi:RNA polymerase sigma-70 factor (ECF subfamily)
MGDKELADRLSRISTCWTGIFTAHQGPPDAALQAQQQLLQRYHRAIYRYALGALRDPDAADDLCQELALRLVRGDFRQADPSRGRFRDYVKTALYHLIVDHQNRRKKQPAPLPDQSVAGDSDLNEAESDREFTERWRAELLSRTWEALAKVEQETGRPLYTVLKLRAVETDLSSDQMAERLSAKLGKPVNATAGRQMLHRAREKFANLLLEEVARSLQTSEPDRLEQELADLDLLAYCRSALDRRGRAE